MRLPRRQKRLLHKGAVWMKRNDEEMPTDETAAKRVETKKDRGPAKRIFPVEILR